MKSLEDAIKEVERLKRDLSAKIIIQEKIDHLEEVGSSGGPCSFDKSYDYEYIVDQHEINKPDTSKTEPAKAELTSIYNSSEWYSARFAAGYALGFEYEKLKDDLEGWLKQLTLELHVPETRLKACEDLRYMYNLLPYKEYRAKAGKLLGHSKPRIWLDENPERVQKILLKTVIGFGAAEVLLHVLEPTIIHYYAVWYCNMGAGK